MSVPNTNTFSQRDVVSEIFKDSRDTDLQSLFTAADGTFDSNYVGSKNSLLNFRNYNHSVLPFVYDYDGNPYTPVRIGNQVWLNSDFKCAHFNDGTAIIGSNTIMDLYNRASSAVPSYFTDIYDFGSTLFHYNYEVISLSNHKIAIPGWHIPSLSELNVLASTLGGANVAGGHMKYLDHYWSTPNVGADNTSGFNGMASGYLGYNSGYDIYNKMYFWLSDSQIIGSSAYYYRAVISYNSTSLSYAQLLDFSSTPIRLIKD